MLLKWKPDAKSCSKSHLDFKQPLLIPFSLFTHEEGEVEEAEDVFGARGAAVGHHDEVEVPLVGCDQVLPVVTSCYQ